MTQMKELYQYREMFRMTILRNLRTRYKGSLLGFLWTFLNPLLMLAVYSMVFTTVIRIDMDYYPLYIFVGLIAWNMFVSSVQDSSVVIMNNANLVKKIYFPRIILPLSQVISALVNYFFSLIILLPILYFTIGLSFNVFWLPYILLVQVVLTTAICLLISSLTVYFRDLQHIIGILIMALFYITPVLFPVSLIPSKYLYLFESNPLFTILEGYHDILFKGISPDVGALSLELLISAVFMVLCWALFVRLNRGFAEEI